MRPDPVLQFRLGLAAIGVLVLAALIMAFAPGLLDRRAPAQVILSNVQGLAEGDEVKDEGFIIGHVTRIDQQLQQRRFLVSMRLDPEWQPKDQQTIGLVILEPNPLKSATLNVVRDVSNRIACPEPTPLDPALTGLQLRGCGHQPSMIELTFLTLNITRDVVKQINQILKELAPDKNGNGSPPASMMKTLTRSLANFEEVSKQVKGMLDTPHQKKIDAILANAAAISKEATVATKNVNRLVENNGKPATAALADLRYILAVTATQMASIAADLQVSSANLKELTTQLRDDPAAPLHPHKLSDPAILSKPR